MTPSLFFPHKAQSELRFGTSVYPLHPTSWSVPFLWGVSLQKPLPSLPLSRLSFPLPPRVPATPRPYSVSRQPQPPACGRRGLVARGLCWRAGTFAAATRDGGRDAGLGFGGARGAPGRLGPCPCGAGSGTAAREKVSEATLCHGETRSGSQAADGNGAALRAVFRATRGPAPPWAELWALEREGRNRWKVNACALTLSGCACRAPAPKCSPLNGFLGSLFDPVWSQGPRGVYARRCDPGWIPS